MNTVSRQMPTNKRSKSRRIWIPIIAVIVIAAAALGYLYWNKQNTQTAEAAEESYYTSQVREGSITITVSGSGTLVATEERNLNFSTSGTVIELNAEVGDQVEEGAVLAVLDNLADLQEDVNSAQQDLIAAQLELETLKKNAAANLANAQLAVIDAEEAVADAESGVVQEGWARCDQDTIDAYYYQYMHAIDTLESLGDGGGSEKYYLTTILPQKEIVASAKASYEYCAGFTDNEIASSNATLSLAKANLTLAEDELATLLENDGIDPIELATAENKIANLQLALDEAQEILDGATMKAPFSGTIISINGSLGDEVDTDTFITISDMSHPQVEFNIDETDLDKAFVGEKANIIFDAVPDQTFTGTVKRINPSLVTSGSYSVISGVIELDLTEENEFVDLPVGLNASVELVFASSENTLLIPLQAVRDLGDGTYAVFVVGADGKPEMRIVELGLQDAASAEIISGVSVGETVTTGTTETY